MLTVFGGARNRGQRVLWALEEMGLDYEKKGVMPHSEEITAISPLGTLPVLVDGDTVVHDSVAILSYLAAKTDQLSAPDGTPERARIDAAINFCTTELEAPLWMAARHSFILPEDQRHPEAKAIARAAFTRAEDRFVKLLGDRPYLAGDTFTIADIVAAHCANWANAAKFELRTRTFLDYAERMTARPAFRRAMS